MQLWGWLWSREKPGRRDKRSRRSYEQIFPSVWDSDLDTAAIDGL